MHRTIPATSSARGSWFFLVPRIGGRIAAVIARREPGEHHIGPQRGRKQTPARHVAQLLPERSVVRREHKGAFIGRRTLAREQQLLRLTSNPSVSLVSLSWLKAFGTEHRIEIVGLLLDGLTCLKQRPHHSDQLGTITRFVSAKPTCRRCVHRGRSSRP